MSTSQHLLPAYSVDVAVFVRSMDAPAIDHVISDLSDLELAVLLSLVCQEHCLVETPAECVDDVSSELALVTLIDLR